METFEDFSKSTRLYVNPNKCKINFGGMDEDTKKEIKHITSFSEGPMPFRYLGIPQSSKKLSSSQCKCPVEKIDEKIRHWSAKLLNYA